MLTVEQIEKIITANMRTPPIGVRDAAQAIYEAQTEGDSSQTKMPEAMSAYVKIIFEIGDKRFRAEMHLSHYIPSPDLQEDIDQRILAWFSECYQKARKGAK